MAGNKLHYGDDLEILRRYSIANPSVSSTSIPQAPKSARSRRSGIGFLFGDQIHPS
jgi:hypothetical protein